MPQPDHLATLAHLDRLDAHLTACEHRLGIRDNPVPRWTYLDHPDDDGRLVDAP